MKSAVVGLLKSVRDQMLALSGSDGAIVSLRESRVGPMIVRTAKGVNQDEIESISGSALLLEAEQSSKGVLVLDSQKDRFRDQQNAFRSAVCVPVVEDGVTVGVLLAFNRTRAGAFSYAELSKVERLAGDLSKELTRANWVERSTTIRKPSRVSGLARAAWAPFLFAALVLIYALMDRPLPEAEPQASHPVQVSGRLLDAGGQEMSAKAIESGRFVLSIAGQRYEVGPGELTTTGGGEFRINRRFPASPSTIELSVYLSGYQTETRTAKVSNGQARLEDLSLKLR
ncbi:MAG: GAF domain-containing protein [Vulcanimicrobiota bacterium]